MFLNTFCKTTRIRYICTILKRHRGQSHPLNMVCRTIKFRFSIRFTSLIKRTTSLIANITVRDNTFQFLAQEAKDPRQQFIFNFVRDAFAHGPGVYVSYNKAFEIGVLRKIAAIYPLYEKPLMYICEHTIDMIDFFKLKGIIPIYHPSI
jgi:hypothetical protein